MKWEGCKSTASPERAKAAGKSSHSQLSRRCTVRDQTTREKLSMLLLLSQNFLMYQKNPRCHTRTHPQRANQRPKRSTKTTPVHHLWIRNPTLPRCGKRAGDHRKSSRDFLTPASCAVYRAAGQWARTSSSPRQPSGGAHVLSSGRAELPRRSSPLARLQQAFAHRCCAQQPCSTTCPQQCYWRTRFAARHVEVWGERQAVRHRVLVCVSL